MSIPMCRLCLVDGIKMNYIKNTHLQDIYEKLSLTKLIDNGRPETFCVSCTEQLKKCHEFAVMSQLSEKIFTQLYMDGIECTPAAVASLKRVKSEPPLAEFESAEETLHQDFDIKEEVECDINGCLIEEMKAEDSLELKNENTYTASVVPSTPDCNTIPSDDIKINFQYKKNLLKEKSYICDICNKKYLWKNSLRKHLTYMHLDDSIKFHKTDQLKKSLDHKISFLTDEKSCIPDVCPKTYSCTDVLKKKILKDTRDDTCKKTFVKNVNSPSRIKSRTVKQDDKYVDKTLVAHSICDRCGKRYANLNRHMRTHTREKPYECDTCGNKFADRGNLKQHFKIHTGYKPHRCNECDVSFALIGNLRRHNMKYHLQGFFCEICRKPFHDGSVLKTHMRIHTGERPFVCECGKTYSDKGNYKRHMRVHTGEKPYACSICEYKSTWANCLKNHMVRMHSLKS